MFVGFGGGWTKENLMIMKTVQLARMVPLV
jgi:hypothetical protein